MAKKAEGNVLRDYGGTILAAVVLAFLVRFFVIEPYFIPSFTMRPTLERGDLIIVSKWPFGFRIPFFQKRISAGRLPQRGEVVLFSPPDDLDRDLIKRVIGLEGDRVQMKKGQLFLNEKPITFKSTQNELCGTESIQNDESHRVCWEPPVVEDFGPKVVPEGSVFLMSDLRTSVSTDQSKNQIWGIFPLSSLKGKVLWIGLSIEPRSFGDSLGHYPRLRFERMFRRIE